jgi:hypothetical protein
LEDNSFPKTAESLKEEASLKKPKKNRPGVSLADVVAFYQQHHAENGVKAAEPETAAEDQGEKKKKKKKSKKADPAVEDGAGEEAEAEVSQQVDQAEKGKKREREDDDEDAGVAKKAKVEAAPQTPKSDNKKSKKSQKSPATPFQRINPNLADDLPEALQDNNWLAREADPYAAKAYKDLSVTKGKGFRHEKTKKKRGTYKGGEIDTGAVNSYFFHNDSE